MGDNLHVDDSTIRLETHLLVLRNCNGQNAPHAAAKSSERETEGQIGLKAVNSGVLIILNLTSKHQRARQSSMANETSEQCCEAAKRLPPVWLSPRKLEAVSPQEGHLPGISVPVAWCAAETAS